MPIRVERRIVDGAGDHRRFGLVPGLADDDLHRIGDPAMVDHVQGRRGGIDHDVAVLERRFAGVVEAGEDARVGRAARLHAAPSSVTQPGVDRIDLAGLRDVLRERGSTRRRAENLHRSAVAWRDPAISEVHAGRRRVKRLNVENPCGGKQAIRFSAGGRVAGTGAGQQRLRAGGEVGTAGQAIERGAAEQLDQLRRGGIVDARPQPQQRARPRRIKSVDRVGDRIGRGGLRPVVRGCGIVRRDGGQSEIHQRRTGGAGQHPGFHV